MRLDFIVYIKRLFFFLLLGAFESARNTPGYISFDYCTLLPPVEYSLCPEINQTKLNLRLISINLCFNTDDFALKCNHLMISNGSYNHANHFKRVLN